MTTPEYFLVAGRIDAEVQSIEEELAAIADEEAAFARGGPADHLHARGLAFGLHALYSGLERVFEAIAREVDGVAPTGPAWHTELLSQMALELPPSRPAVISQRSFAVLDDLRAVRHRIRNLYSRNIDPALILLNLDRFREAWPAIRAELGAFAAALRGE